MKKILTVAGIALFSTAALAEAPAFTDADTNADGVLSMEEVKAALPEMEQSVILAADTNNDGGISEDEYTALTAS